MTAPFLGSRRDGERSRNLTLRDALQQDTREGARNEPEQFSTYGSFNIHGLSICFVRGAVTDATNTAVMWGTSKGREGTEGQGVKTLQGQSTERCRNGRKPGWPECRQREGAWAGRGSLHSVQTSRPREDLKPGSCRVRRDEDITHLDVGAGKSGKMLVLT